MSGVRSGRGAKAKGSNYERELASYLSETIGVTARRALLSGGGRNDGGADLEGTPEIHIEAKRTETFAPYAAMEQAEVAIKKGGKPLFPVVMQRRNRMATGESMVVMRLSDWVDFYAAYLRQEGVALDSGKNNFLRLLDASKDGV